MDIQMENILSPIFILKYIHTMDIFQNISFSVIYLFICSIHAALMLAYFGAGGVTEQELSKVLGK